MLRPGLPGRISSLTGRQRLRQRAPDGAADAALQVFIRGALERGVRRDVRVVSCTSSCGGFLQNSYARFNHFAECRGILAQHALRELRARRAELLRRIPYRAEVGVVDFLEQASSLRGSASLSHSAGIQFFERAGILRTRKRRAIRRRLRPRLLHAIPKLPRLFPAPGILHLRRQPRRRLHWHIQLWPCACALICALVTSDRWLVAGGGRRRWRPGVAICASRKSLSRRDRNLLTCRFRFRLNLQNLLIAQRKQILYRAHAGDIASYRCGFLIHVASWKGLPLCILGEVRYYSLCRYT